MKEKSPLVSLFIVCVCLASFLPPTLIRPGAALPDPSLIASWSVQPTWNPTVLIGSTKIDFRLYPRSPKIYPGFYIFDTATATETLRDDDRYNWPGESHRYASIALDVSGTADKEIITVNSDASGIFRLRCIAIDGTDVWERLIGSVYDQLGCPALYDFDHDGNYEIVFGHYDDNGQDQLVIVNAEDGTINLTIPISGKPISAPVIGDADNDGDVEIALMGQTNRRLYLINPNGTIEWQYTVSSDAWTSPIIGDFDADGEVEVVVLGDNGNLYYIRGQDGSLKKTIPTIYSVWPGVAPVAADLNGDGYLEIVVSAVKDRITAVSWDGSKKVWPTSLQTGISRLSTPAISDTDTDGIPEIITVDSHIRVFDWTGGETYSRTPGASSWTDNGNSPIVFDSNNNGFLDIVYFITKLDLSGTRLYRVPTTVSAAQKGWPTLKGDFRRSGVYGSDTYGDDPDVIITNRNWTYGNVSQGSNEYKDFDIMNVGQATLTGQCIDTTKIDIDNNAPFSIPPGTSQSFRATFDTSAQGNHTGFVVITTNDPDEPKFNITATANITKPEHDVAAYMIHVDNQLNPNYVNVPPIKVEFRNLGSFWEGGIATNMTINGIFATPLTPATFDLDAGEATNVTFYWDRTNPALSGEGTFVLEAAAQNVNYTLEANQLNNRITKNVEVSYPIKVESITSYLMTNLTYGMPSNNFTEGDWISLKVTFSNQWNVPVTLIPMVNINRTAGSVLDKGFALPEMTIPVGEERTIQPTFLLDQDVAADTSYEATAYAWDRLGGGVKILADPYVHTFWVQPST